MELIAAIAVSILSGIIVHYICKWLDKMQRR